MPDPIPSNNPTEEPVKKLSGFDPMAYEAEKATSEPGREIPIQMRMYQDVIDITVKRAKEYDKHITSKVKKTEEYTVPFQRELDILRLSGDETENNKLELWTEKIPLPIQSIGNTELTIEGIILPGKGNMTLRTGGEKLPEDENYAVIHISPYNSTEDMWSIQDEFSPRGISPDGTYGMSLSSSYLVVLHPEMPPTIIQERIWDKENYSWTQKLVAYPHHDLTDEEFTAILQAIATAPL